MKWLTLIVLTACSFNTNVYIENEASTYDADIVDANDGGVVQDANQDSGVAHPACLDRSGTYHSQFSQVSGNCGSHTNPDISIANDQFQGWTNEALSVVDGNCEVLYSNSVLDNGYWGDEMGDIHWSQDGSSGQGVVYSASGTQTTNCMSTYTVVFSR